jgi:hypothetical protein
VFAQLRDMLAAKNSSIMPQKNEHGRLIRPQRPEPHLRPIAIGENDFTQLVAQ